MILLINYHIVSGENYVSVDYDIMHCYNILITNIYWSHIINKGSVEHWTRALMALR